jgi:hypothetical protein
MQSSERKDRDWRETESMEDAARRLWRDWDERKAKKAAEGLERSAQFADQQPTRSLVGLADKGGLPERYRRLNALDGSPQFTAGREDMAGGDPVAEVGRSNGIGNAGGQAGFGISSSLKYKDTACPTLDEALADRSRRYPDAPEDW